MAVLDLPHPQGGAAPVAPQPPLHQLFEALAAVFAAEKAQNNTTIDSSMPQEAFQRLDNQVRALLAAYQGQVDFREYCRWHAQHYVRNLIASNDDLELMVSQIHRACLLEMSVRRSHGRQPAPQHALLDGAPGALPDAGVLLGQGAGFAHPQSQCITQLGGCPGRKSRAPISVCSLPLLARLQAPKWI